MPATPPPESTERHIAPGSGWEDSPTFITTGTTNSFEASWYLTRNRIWPLVRHPVYGPVVLGVVFFAIVSAMLVFSPSAESHFIYTDF